MPESEGTRQRTWPPLAEAGTAAVGLCVFALFIHAGLPLVLLSACGLAAAALAVHRSLTRESPRAALFGISRLSRPAIVLTVLGCVVGLALGVLYRWYCDRALFPGALRGFAALAALIGATEEIVYRGYVQGRARTLGAFPAVVLAALCHAAYKCALFALPASPVQTDFLVLATWTFLGGLVFGALRELAGNIAPALAAHACFDIVVYGDLAQAPWWVWS